MLSDDEIIESVKNGHSHNFEIIINRYKKSIINFVHKMLDDPDEAQNIAQDVFIAIFRTLHRYKMQGNFQSFIFTIAKNHTLNHIKKRKRILLLSSLTTHRETHPALRYEEDKQKVLEQERQEKLFLSALKSLKENQRLAIILKVYLDLSYKKIADITGWSIPKIETLIFRAKTQLKNKIYMQENRIQDVEKVRIK